MLKTHGVLHFSLAVTDLDRSRKFYEQLLGMKVVEQSPRMVFLQTGDDYLILAKGNEPLKYDSSKSTRIFNLRLSFCAETVLKCSTSKTEIRESSGDRKRIF
jgi:catechol 2,3-dioxygenase-like lactoylglutathione lyase family enzyme